MHKPTFQVHDADQQRAHFSSGATTTDANQNDGFPPLEAGEVRVDLHVHSSFSDKPYSWFLKATKAAECYTSPKLVYDLATQRGMNVVTICDHDAIEGALELCALASNTFVSEEISARFPEDGCVMHTIAVNITEAQHAEIQRLRRNIYELTQYLYGERIEYFLCHPLSQVNRRLDPSHIKRCLLMFKTLELRNGTRDGAHEMALRRITAGMTPEKIERWAEEFPGTPVLNPEARYGFVGGSDDHAGLSIARAFTSFRGEPTGAGVTAALNARTTAPAGQSAMAHLLSHNIYGVMGGYVAQAMKAPAPPPEPAHDDDDHGHDHGGSDGYASMERSLEKFMRAFEESGREIDLAALAKTGHRDDAQAEMFETLQTVLVRSTRSSFETLMDAVVKARPADFADRVPDVLKALMLAVPDLAGARAFAHDRREARTFAARLGSPLPHKRGPRVAVLSDTLDGINGVALGLRRLAGEAQRRGFDLRLVTNGPGDLQSVDADGIVRLPTLLRHRFAEYPEMEFGIPHLSALLHYLIDEEIDLVQCSTPGPVGLIGLLAGRLAGVPVVGQYHTDLPEYATRILGDAVVGAMVGRLVGWFYGALDRVLVPSRAVAERLAQLRVPADRLQAVPRGIDLELFTPERRQEHAFEAFGLNGEPKVLYVGRLSREKGLDALLDAFAQLAEELPAAKLVLVGEGPHGEYLAKRAGAPERVIFTGALTGERLASLYASSDVFVYPSETETFGNAVVEAQAAGVPVVVANRGAARENVLEGVTGLVVDTQDPQALSAAIRELLSQPELRQRMGVAASRFARRYDLKSAVEGTFAIYETLVGNKDVIDAV